MPKAQIEDLSSLFEGQALAKAVVVSSPLRNNSPMHSKEFQILNDQPQFAEIDAGSLVEIEAEYVDVPVTDVPEVHLVTEVSCSTSGCFMFQCVFSDFFIVRFFPISFSKFEFENYHRY